jgi:O-antigen/teichoic acid export membrane protein
MNDEQLPRLLVLFVPYLLIFPIAKTAIAALQSQKQSGRATLSRDLAPYVGAIALFVVLAANGIVEFGAVVYWVSVPFFMTMFGLYNVNDRFSIRTLVSSLPEYGTVKRLWSFSWPLAIGMSFTMLFSNLDVLMIGYFLESGSVGQYRAIQPLRQVTGFVLTAFLFLYYPIATEYFSDDAIGDLDDLYSTSTKWIVGTTIPPVLLLAFFAPDVIRVFFGAPYVPAAPALTVLVLGMSVRALVGPSGTTIKAIDRPRVELFGSFVGVVVNLALNVVLIPRYGIVGAAVATATGFATFNLIEILFIYRAIGIHPFRASTFKPLIPTVVVAALLAYGTRGRPLSFVALAVIGVLIGLAYLASLVLTRSLDDEDRFMIEQFQQRTGVDLTRLEDIVKYLNR